MKLSGWGKFPEVEATLLEFTSLEELGSKMTTRDQQLVMRRDNAMQKMNVNKTMEAHITQQLDKRSDIAMQG